MEDKIGLRWRKSGYSGNGGNCVEVAGRGSRVLVRDTRQDGAGPVLRFSPAIQLRDAIAIPRCYPDITAPAYGNELRSHGGMTSRFHGP